MKRYNRNISVETLKFLLARSGNQCAFPDCSHPVFDDNNVFIAQLCHIECVSPGGERYNPIKTDNEINAYENLLFMCYRHHKVTDNVELFNVQKLKEIKENHEAKFKEATFNYSKEVLIELSKEINSFWNNIEQIHSAHIAPEFAVPIDKKKDILTLIDEINSDLISMNEVNNKLINDCGTTHFESLCLAIPNLLISVKVALDQIEIKHIEELLIKDPINGALKIKLKSLRDEFTVTSQSKGFYD